jgi:hypothetical protein
MLSLLAMSLLVIVFNAHTDSRCTGGGQAERVWQAVNSHRDHCAACELTALGAGHTVIVPAVQVEAVHTQEAIPAVPTDLIKSSHHTTIASRAPPA